MSHQVSSVRALGREPPQRGERGRSRRQRGCKLGGQATLGRAPHTRGGEAGREAGRPLSGRPAAPLPRAPCQHSPGRRAERGRRHLRAGPGGALAAARGVSCQAEPRRAARPRGDSPAGLRAPLPPLDRSHFSCTKSGRPGRRRRPRGEAVRAPRGGKGGRPGGGGARLPRGCWPPAASTWCRCLEQLSSAVWGGSGRKRELLVKCSTRARLGERENKLGRQSKGRFGAAAPWAACS